MKIYRISTGIRCASTHASIGSVLGVSLGILHVCGGVRVLLLLRLLLIPDSGHLVLNEREHWARATTVAAMCLIG